MLTVGSHDPRATGRIDHPGDGGEGDTREFRDFVDVRHLCLTNPAVLLHESGHARPGGRST